MGIRTKKSVFYHTPRTGGISVKEAIRLSGINYDRTKHSQVKNRLKMYTEHATPDGTIAEDKDGLFSFCFVRHPIDWYKSFWSFRVAKGHVQIRNPLDYYCWDTIFERFVANALDYYPDGYVTELYKLFVGENLDKVDFIGKQENLVNDLILALNMAGEEFDEDVIRNLKKYNRTFDRRAISPRLGLSDYTRDRVLRVEKWVMDNFYV